MTYFLFIANIIEEHNCTMQYIVIGVIGLINLILLVYAGYTTITIRRIRAKGIISFIISKFVDLLKIKRYQSKEI